MKWQTVAMCSVLVALVISPEAEEEPKPALTDVGVATLAGGQATRPATAVAGAADGWARIRQDIEREEYAATRGRNGLQAPNRAQRFRTSFRPDGIEVVPRSGAPTWRWRWTLQRWGRRAAERHVFPAEPRWTGNRVEYAHAGLVEWYENRTDGLEQGFDLAQRVPGEGPLTIAGRVECEALRPHPAADGRALDFSADGGQVLRLSRLVVRDAAGKEFDAAFELAGDELCIRVDDTGAQYPIVVDPCFTFDEDTALYGQGPDDFFGHVASAGDVNGDGYDDVIVGAPDYDVGGVPRGKVYLYLGKRFALHPTAIWTAVGDVDYGGFGEGVGTAGDFNGDGFDDVIVSAPHADNVYATEGRVLIWFGSGDPEPLGADSNPAGADLSLWGSELDPEVFSQFGSGGVATAGDVNGDGYDDVIVGAPYFSDLDAIPNAMEVGRSYICLGGPAPDLVPDWFAQGEAENDRFGRRVAAAGDVDADGYDDILVSAANLDNEGKVYVYRGAAGGIAAAAPTLLHEDDAVGWHGYFFGSSIATAGSVNDDRYSDVIVGASFYSNGGAAEEQEGMVFVYYGSAAGVQTEPAWNADSDNVQAHFGADVAPADFNGDGYGDVVVAAPGYHEDVGEQGAVYVYLGGAAGLEADPEVCIKGRQEGAGEFSVGVASGDVNGDGFSDLLAGYPGYERGAMLHRGAVFVYNGPTLEIEAEPDWGGGVFVGGGGGGGGDVDIGPFIPDVDKPDEGVACIVVGEEAYDSGGSDVGIVSVYRGSVSGPGATPVWQIVGIQPGARLGASVAAAGDVNNDGYLDILAGAPGYSNGQPGEGIALLYLGTASGFASAPAWTFEGNQPGAALGRSVARAGDVNGDGYGDVVVAAPLYDNGQTDEGRALLFLGGASGLGSSPVWAVEANQNGAQLGSALAGGADINGDGRSDVIVGSPNYNPGFTAAGRVDLYLGTATGLGTMPAWTQSGIQNNAHLGAAVAAAGDVNGDGTSDLVVGAPGYTGTLAGEGIALGFHGSATGLGTTPAWIVVGGQGGAGFGGAVAPAGDVNHDGMSDVAVGAPGYDDMSLLDAGTVRVFMGSGTGLGTAAAWSSTGGQGGAALGSVLAGMGDVNGDGNGDFVALAPLYDDPPTTDEGRAFLFYGNGRGFGRKLGQGRIGGDPLSLLGRSDFNALRLRIHAHSPAGRGKVRLQWEIKPLGVPFDGLGLGSSNAMDTGPPAAGGGVLDLDYPVGGLSTSTAYCWRVRVLTDSPYFARSPWFSPSGNAPTEMDFRTSNATTEVAETLGPRGGSTLFPCEPNPFRTFTTIQYHLADALPVRMRVYDVAGRLVRSLEQAPARTPGRHLVQWDGRNDRGTPAAAGVYLCVLEAGQLRDSRRVVLLR